MRSTGSSLSSTTARHIILAIKVDGQSAEDIEAKFNEMWLLPFGPPKAVVIDLEGGLQSALGRLCDWHGIGVRSVAAQSHWQAGVVERQQAWWKHIWEKVSCELSITEDEVELAVPIISAEDVAIVHRNGFSARLREFQKTSRTPMAGAMFYGTSARTRSTRGKLP